MDNTLMTNLEAHDIIRETLMESGWVEHHSGWHPPKDRTHLPIACDWLTAWYSEMWQMTEGPWTKGKWIPLKQLVSIIETHKPKNRYELALILLDE